MKFFLCFFIAIILFNSHTFSQWGNYESALGINAIVGIPIGDFSNTTEIGYGIKGKYIMMFNDNLGWLNELSYLKWPSKNDYWTFSYSDYIVNSGVKINFMPEAGPYFLILLGIHFVNFEWESPQGNFSISGSNEEFNVSGGFGYEYELGDNIYIDTNLNYSYLTDSETSYIGINIGVNFGLY